MPIELRLLTKVLVVPFYRRNAGFFLVAFLLLFGVAGEKAWPMHRAILQAIGEFPVVGLATALCWLLYASKCLQYGLKTVSLPENEWVHAVSLLPFRRQFVGWLVVHAGMNAPVLAYASAAVVTAVFGGAYVSAGCIVLGHGLLGVAVAGIYRRQIHSNPERTPLRYFPSLRWRKSYPAFFWAYLLNEEKVLLLSTKAFSMLLLAGTFPLYASVEYDERMLRLGFVLSALSHAVLVYQLRQFEESRLVFTRNLPWSLPRRFNAYARVYGVVLVPELGFLLRYAAQTHFSGPFGWTQWLGYFVLALSLCLACHGGLFIAGMTMEKYVSRLFFGFVGLFLLVMYRVPPLLLAGGLLAAGFGWLHRHYYRFEELASEEEPRED